MVIISINIYKDKMLIYTYNFEFPFGEVTDALISLNTKYLLVNNRYIFLLPSIEIIK